MPERLVPIPQPPIGRVALDAMGVIFAQRGVPAALASFAAEHGARVDEADAREVYQRASLGRCSSAALWAALAIPGPDRDAEFLAGRVPRPGFEAFLEALGEERIPVGCITNDLAEWSEQSRRSHGLDRLVPWVVSGEIGARKPEPAIFERFLEDAHTEAGRCLFVDDKVRNLDGARALGFQTAWFCDDAGPARVGGGSHPRVRSFDDVLDLILQKRATTVA